MRNKREHPVFTEDLDKPIPAALSVSNGAT